MQEMDQRDRELVSVLQGDIQLVGTPYAVVGQLIEMSEKDVIKRTERLKREGVIKQISAQFDARALGYRTCLVAARVNPDRIDDAASVINAHPGVTQNYRRNHDFNLWFTLLVSPLSKLGVEKTVSILGELAGCEEVRLLPALKTYKSAEAEPHGGEEPHGEYTPLTPQEIEAVRLLQRDLPLQPRPFDVLARGSGLTGDDLLALGRTLLKRGQMRRFGGVVASRKGGFVASAMGVWIVPEERADEYGMRLAQNRAVSHCYRRPVYGDWPYNLYTIVHGRSVDECESIINDLAIDTGLTEKHALYPTKEYKKARIVFFSADADQWEAAHESGRTATAAS